MNKLHKLKNNPLAVILVAILIVMALLNFQRFYTSRNFISMAYQLPILGFLSIGMMISMLSGGINLAIVSTANFTGIITALTLQYFSGNASAEASPGLALSCLAIGFVGALAIGLISGFLIAYLEVPAILATLGIQLLLDGVNILLTKGYTLSGFPQSLLSIGNGKVFGLPIPFLIFIVVALILHFVLAKTAFGYSLYMVGSSPKAALYSNIKNKVIIMKEYVLSSAMAGIAAIIMLGQLNSVKANYWQSYVLVAVLACFLGGVDAFGGAGKMTGMVLSIVILQIVSTGVNLMRVDPFFVQAMWGFIIIVLVAVNKIQSAITKKNALKVHLSKT